MVVCAQNAVPIVRYVTVPPPMLLVEAQPVRTAPVVPYRYQTARAQVHTTRSARAVATHSYLTIELVTLIVVFYLSLSAGVSYAGMSPSAGSHRSPSSQQATAQSNPAACGCV